MHHISDDERDARDAAWREWIAERTTAWHAAREAEIAEWQAAIDELLLFVKEGQDDRSIPGGST